MPQDLNTWLYFKSVINCYSKSKDLTKSIDATKWILLENICSVLADLTGMIKRNRIKVTPINGFDVSEYHLQVLGKG